MQKNPDTRRITNSEASPVASVQRPPRAALLDRVDFITSRARGQRVIDLGFVDQSRMRSKQDLGTWLHAKVANSASEAVGIDSDDDGVRRAQELGYTCYAADCEDRGELQALGLEPADLVIAGELIEHLDLPGHFLEAVKVLAKPAGALLITTPNAMSMTNFLSSAMRRELVNPDHVHWFSWHTLRTLLGRHGWEIDRVAYYAFPKVHPPVAPSRSDRVRTQVFNSYQRAFRPLFRVRPTLADGLIVEARRARA